MTPDAHDLNRLAAFAEGRLDPDQRRRMTAHLASCAECRTILAALVREGGVGQTPAVRPVEQRRSLFGALRARPRVALPVAATIVVAVLAAGLLRVRTAPRPAQPVAPSAAPSIAPVPDDRTQGLLARREVPPRKVDGKRFRLVAGEWVDADYDVAAALPVVVVNTPGQRTRLLAGEPGLRPFAALGDRVTVVFHGTVYRFGDSSSR